MRVLLTEREPNKRTNPFITQLFEAVRHEGIDALGWTYARAMGRYDVLHVHWPEFLVSKKTLMRRVAARALFIGMLIRITLFNTPVVRTVHNEAPHDGLRRIDAWLISRLDKHVRIEIHMSSASFREAKHRSTIIPHGDYREWYRDTPPTEPIRGRIGYVGSIRPYKGLESLLSAFENTPRDLALKLDIHGHAASARYAQKIATLCRADSRVSFSDGFLDDDALAREVRRSQMIILPYNSILNSGVALLALSLDRPILGPDTESMRELRDEFGPDWVHLFRGALSSSDIVLAMGSLDAARVQPSPHMKSRSWEVIGRRHREVYEEAARR